MGKCGNTKGYELEVIINWEKQGPFVWILSVVSNLELLFTLEYESKGRSLEYSYYSIMYVLLISYYMY